MISCKCPECGHDMDVQNCEMSEIIARTIRSLIALGKQELMRLEKGTTIETVGIDGPMECPLCACQDCPPDVILHKCKDCGILFDKP